MARMVSNTRLTAEDHFQDTRHIEFDLGAEGPTHDPGDILTVFPKQNPDSVQRFLEHLQLDPQAWVRIHLSDPPASASASMEVSLIHPNPAGNAHQSFHQQIIIKIELLYSSASILKLLASYHSDISDTRIFGNRTRHAEGSNNTCAQQVRLGALVAGVLDVDSASPRRFFFEVLQHFATDELQIERLQYFASAEGRDDLALYNQSEGLPCRISQHALASMHLRKAHTTVEISWHHEQGGHLHAMQAAQCWRC